MSKKKLLLLIGGGVLGLCCVGGVVANAVGGDKTGTETASDNPPVEEARTETETKAAPTQAAQPKKTDQKPSGPKIGQAARDGKFEFVVQKVDCGKTEVGEQFLNKTAQGQFCLVSLSVKNVGDKQQLFDGSSQKAIGASGATYGHDGTAELYANKQNQTFLNQINPGNQVTGLLVFDIPKDATIKTLELHDSPFSGGVKVDVG